MRNLGNEIALKISSYGKYLRKGLPNLYSAYYFYNSNQNQFYTHYYELS